MLDVVRDLVGVHAQVMSSAELTLWARVDGLDRDAVARALWEERSLVKLWAMRGTLHLAPAREHAAWVAALSTYDGWRKPAWRRYFRVALEELDELVATIGVALDGRQLTREELGAEVIRLSGHEHLAQVLRESWGGFLKPPSFLGELCFAPSDGQRVRFTNPASWLDNRGDAPEDPVGQMFLRYLASHGPAPADDVRRWWAGLSGARARAVLEGRAERLTIEGEDAWAAPGFEPAEPVETVRLLPAFDQYVVAATRHAERLLPDPALRTRIYRNQGWLTPVLCVDGRMDGVWRFERKGKRLVVTIEPFTRLSRATRAAAEREAESLAAFLGGSLELSWES